jgi:hypothetical protein
MPSARRDFTSREMDGKSVLIIIPLTWIVTLYYNEKQDEAS